MAEKLTEKTEGKQPHPAWAAVDEDSSIDIVGLYQALRSGKTTILLTSLVTLVLATVSAFGIPSRYTSTVSFIPPNLTSSSSSLTAALSGQLATMGGGELFGMGRNAGDLYAGILQSRSIAGDLVRRFDLMRAYGVKKESQAEKVLDASTSVVVDTKSGIVTVSVTDKNPGRAHDMANAYMEALRVTNGRLALSQSSQRRLFFGQQLEREKNDLENAEVELKTTQEESGLIAPTGQTDAEIRTIAEIQAQIAMRQVQLAALHQAATEQNPEIIRLRSEIGDLQGQLSRLQKGNGANSITIPTSKVPQVQLEYVRKQREVKYHEALFEMLSKQYEAARLDEAREAPIVQVLDFASYPDTRSSPKRLYIMIGGFLAGLIGSSIWILIRIPLKELRVSAAETTA